ncbi:MAG TPA: 4Fe-4S dicluster domain-containing protein [Symbiobacteriaceae bacterium]|nr:4Fe-4S dicluster domain-containing protein [Symbiobacteriaceae bacterium]
MVQLDRWADAVAGWRRVRIDAARCLPRVSPRSHCDACVAVCPEGAITLEASPTVRDCSACGLCAASCTADAITLDNPSDDQLVQRFVAHGRKASRLSLTCMAGPAGPEQVGCLGRLTPELLLAGAAGGFTAIELVAGPCSGCQYSKGRILGEEAARTAQAILQELNHSCQIRLMESHEWKLDLNKQTGTGVTAPVYQERRAFLLSAFGLLRDLVPLVPARKSQNEPGFPQMSRRREILRWALAELPVAEQISVPWGETGVRLSGRCLHCGICQRLCPNAAIKVVAGTGLQLETQRCHTCGLCTNVCPVSALSLEAPYTVHSVANGAPVVLGEAAAYHCARCGAAVEATGEGDPLCLACSIRSHQQEVVCL